jgi:hypothetical protein
MLWHRFRRIVAIPPNNGRQLGRQLLTAEDPTAGAPHLGNIVDGPGFMPTAIAVFNIP